MQGLKSAILAIFQTGPEWPSTVSAALKNPSQNFKNHFALGANEFLAMLWVLPTLFIDGVGINITLFSANQEA